VNSELWISPPLSELATKPAIVQKLWGIGETSKRLLDSEWVEVPKMVFNVGETSFEFYRHSDLFSSVRCDLLINKWIHYQNNDLKLPREITGWERQAFTFYGNCYNKAIEDKRKLDDG
jgi:hypothetical protein